MECPQFSGYGEEEERGIPPRKGEGVPALPFPSLCHKLLETILTSQDHTQVD